LSVSFAALKMAFCAALLEVVDEVAAWNELDAE
jgi:hypothetical protein